MIAGLRRAIRRLRAVRRGHPRLNVLVGTLTPTGGAILASYASADTDRRRRQVNYFIRTSGIADGVVAFDRALRDPADPSRLAPRYDGGDGVHPSSAGYRRMAQAVNLAQLKGPAC